MNISEDCDDFLFQITAKIGFLLNCVKLCPKSQKEKSYENTKLRVRVY